MPKFEITVERYFKPETVTLEIEATTRDEAEDLAITQARKNEELYFGERIGAEPSFEVSDIYGDDESD